MKVLRDIQERWISNEELTWEDVNRFLKSDPHWSLVVGVFLLVFFCTYEAVMIVSLYFGLW